MGLSKSGYGCLLGLWIDNITMVTLITPLTKSPEPLSRV